MKKEPALSEKIVSGWITIISQNVRQWVSIALIFRQSQILKVFSLSADDCE